MSPFCILSEQRMMEVVLITRAIRRAKFQSSHHQHAVFYRPNVLPVARPVLGQLTKNINFIMNDGGSGGGNWSYKSCKAPVKSSPPTNQHPVFVEAGCPSSRPTNNVSALKGKLYRQLGFTNFIFTVDYITLHLAKAELMFVVATKIMSRENHLHW